MVKTEKNKEKTPKKNINQMLDNSIFDFTLNIDEFKDKETKKIEVSKEKNTLGVSSENYEKVLKLSEKLFGNKEMVIPALEYIIHNFNN